jgi:hypothetical protein
VGGCIVNPPNFSLAAGGTVVLTVKFAGNMIWYAMLIPSSVAEGVFRALDHIEQIQDDEDMAWRVNAPYVYEEDDDDIFRPHVDENGYECDSLDDISDSELGL